MTIWMFIDINNKTYPTKRCGCARTAFSSVGDGGSDRVVSADDHKVTSKWVE